MKKLFFIICVLLITNSSYATQMCARRDTTVVPLDSVVDGTTSANYPREWMWMTRFSYGNVYGVSTCLSDNEVATLLPSDDDDLMGRSGTDADGNIRNKCYCKINHPMSSLWVLDGYGNHCTDTIPICQCDSAFKIDWWSLRTNKFIRIGYGYEEIGDEYKTAISLN